MHSNTKHKGKPLHYYARKNIKIDRQAKKRKIYDLKFTYLKSDILSFSVICSSGTYIRTLVQDISNKWNIHSCLFELHRSMVEPFCDYPVIDLNTVISKDISNYIITIPEMLSGLSSLICTDDDINKLHSGLSIVNNEFFAEQTLCKIFDKNNNFHGVGAIANNSIYPKRLMKR